VHAHAVAELTGGKRAKELVLKGYKLAGLPNAGFKSNGNRPRASNGSVCRYLRKNKREKRDVEQGFLLKSIKTSLLLPPFRASRTKTAQLFALAAKTIPRFSELYD
jgi:hypothetical protein